MFQESFSISFGLIGNGLMGGVGFPGNRFKGVAPGAVVVDDALKGLNRRALVRRVMAQEHHVVVIAGGGVGYEIVHVVFAVGCVGGIGVPVVILVALGVEIRGELAHDPLGVIPGDGVGRAAGEADVGRDKADFRLHHLGDLVQIVKIRLFRTVDFVFVRGGVQADGVAFVVGFADQMLILGIHVRDEKRPMDVISFEDFQNRFGVFRRAVVKGQVDDFFGRLLVRSRHAAGGQLAPGFVDEIGLGQSSAGRLAERGVAVGVGRADRPGGYECGAKNKHRRQSDAYVKYFIIPYGHFNRTSL